jgi:hypothetical protein
LVCMDVCPFVFVDWFQKQSGSFPKLGLQLHSF